MMTAEDTTAETTDVVVMVVMAVVVMVVVVAMVEVTVVVAMVVEAMVEDHTVAVTVVVVDMAAVMVADHHMDKGAHMDRMAAAGHMAEVVVMVVVHMVDQEVAMVARGDMEVSCMPSVKLIECHGLKINCLSMFY